MVWMAPAPGVALRHSWVVVRSKGAIHTIENAFSEIKAHLRKAAERTVDGLWSAIGRVIDLFTPAECRNYFKAAGYDAN